MVNLENNWEEKVIEQQIDGQSMENYMASLILKEVEFARNNNVLSIE